MDVTTSDFWILIGVSVLCGGVIGLERQVRGKPAGIRTSMLICLGTALFITLGRSELGPNSDTTRVLGQVVTGIGFLGAGVILIRGEAVMGVTSAAVIWLMAAIGAMIGFEQYLEAIVISFLTVGILSGIRLLEARYAMLRRGAHALSKDNQESDH